MPFKVAAFYQFAALPDFRELRESLRAACADLGLKGSVLLAHEGINGTLAGSADAVGQSIQALRNGDLFGGRLDNLELKFSAASAMPFQRLKIRLKKEIVTLGDSQTDPTRQVGIYVDPADWNALIAAPDTLLIDTRNAFEVAMGTFAGALDPGLESFGQFKDFAAQKLDPVKHRKIAMFCTGGIRCEKASSFLKHEGFENVFHLKGGILKYLEEVKSEDSLWQGGCFVFDERVAVGHGLKVLDFSICHGCLAPVSADDRASAKFEQGVCCPACADKLSDEQKASNRERQRQVDLAAKRGLKHLGPL